MWYFCGTIGIWYTTNISNAEVEETGVKRRKDYTAWLVYWIYLIIPQMAGPSESAFLFLDKNGAVTQVMIIHLPVQQPLKSTE